MERHPFGAVDRKAVVIGQGTWYNPDDDRASAVAALRRGLDLGMTHIDTAEMYLSGVAEEMVGEVIAGRRDQVFLVSKVLPQHASRHGTVEACEGSLARLKTNYLDCYLLHWRGENPLEDTFTAFEQLRSQGKIRSWGVSNFDEADLNDAWNALGRTVEGPSGDDSLVCNQVLYNLQQRAIEHAVLPWCEMHGLAVVGYSPFGHGNFPTPRTPEGRVLAEIAAAHNATPRQVALRCLVRRPSLFTIPKAALPEHAAENAGAGDLQLTEDELARIDQAFPVGPHPRVLPVL